MDTFEHALTGAGVDVASFVMVDETTVPADMREHARHMVAMGIPMHGWTEVGQPMRGCQFGCKLYARAYPASGFIRYAIFHSRSYGHGPAPVTIARPRVLV